MFFLKNLKTQDSRGTIRWTSGFLLQMIGEETVFTIGFSRIVINLMIFKNRTKTYFVIKPFLLLVYSGHVSGSSLDGTPRSTKRLRTK